MPRLDGTGPAGQGKMTGRGMGKCEGAFNEQGNRRGMGGGFGGACGRRRGMGGGRCFNNNTNVQAGDQK